MNMPDDYQCKIDVKQVNIACSSDLDKTEVSSASNNDETEQVRADPQSLRITSASAYIDTEQVKVPSRSRKTQDMNCLSELGVYRLVMRSNKPEALDFQDWVYRRIKDMREAMGYEQWKINAFMESAKRHHIDMAVIKEWLNPDDKMPYIKSHTVTNKCMANLVGEKKAISKDELKARYPDMIPLRDDVLTDVTDLMRIAKRFKMDISVSNIVYQKYRQ